MKNPGGYIGEALRDEIERENAKRRKRYKQRSEAAVKAAIVKYLKGTGVRFFRMQSGSILGAYKGKPWMMSLCPPGTPDILVLLRVVRPPAHTALPEYETRVLWLEVKRPLGVRGGTGGSEQNPDQIAFEAEAKRHGERYAVVRSVDDVIAALGATP